MNIQNLAGVNNVKWRSKRDDEICVSSISFDFTVSVWSMNYEYHPKAVFKGHKDVVNGFVLSPKEDFIITASRDNYLIYQSFSNAYCPFDACNKAALGFNVDDVLIFRTEHPVLTFFIFIFFFFFFFFFNLEKKKKKIKFKMFVNRINFQIF